MCPAQFVYITQNVTRYAKSSVLGLATWIIESAHFIGDFKSVNWETELR